MAGQRPLRVAIVGAGVIGELHADVIAEMPEFSVGAIFSPRVDAATRLADRISSSQAERPLVSTDVEECFARCDLVTICSPSGTHAELAQRALAAGRHVLIEKPLDVSLPAAEAVVAAAAAAGPKIVCSVVSQHRFNPSSVAVHAALRSGRLGKPTSAVVLMPWWRGERYYASAGWRGTRALDGGGALMNQGIHQLDLLLWLMGPVRVVQARQATLVHRRLEVEDTLVATVGFESGALGTLLFSTAAYPQLPARLQVHGALGSAVIEADELAYFHCSAADFSGERHDSASGANTAAAEVAAVDDGRGLAWGVSHRRQYEDLARAIRSATLPAVTAGDALATLTVVESLYRSAESGREVEIPG